MSPIEACRRLPIVVEGFLCLRFLLCLSCLLYHLITILVRQRSIVCFLLR